MRGAMRMPIYLFRFVTRHSMPNAATHPEVKDGIKNSDVGAGFEL